jgi:RNA polymerase sigma-70 factor (ECF subfamily)
MADLDPLADEWSANRAHLHAVAYRMLGSLAEADDAVQQAWLKVSRADTREVTNLGGWMTTAVARVCLDMLRSRRSRREDTLDAPSASGADPEAETALANSVGLALLVVLDALAPPERVAFVLHDLFDVSFEEIARILERTPAAARQLASRARRRVRGSPGPSADATRKREIVHAFLAAARGGDFDALVAVLDPNVVLRLDSTAARAGAPVEVHGAGTLARRAIASGARAAQPGLVGGEPGVVIAPFGRLWMEMRFTVENGKVVAVDAIGDADRLRELEIAVLS